MALRVQMQASNDGKTWTDVNDAATARKYQFIRAVIGYPNTGVTLSVITLPPWVNELINGKK